MWGMASQWESIRANDFGVMESGTSQVGDTSDPSSAEGAAGTDGDNFG